MFPLERCLTVRRQKRTESHLLKRLQTVVKQFWQRLPVPVICENWRSLELRDLTYQGKHFAAFKSLNEHIKTMMCVLSGPVHAGTAFYEYLKGFYLSSLCRHGNKILGRANQILFFTIFRERKASNTSAVFSCGQPECKTTMLHV